MPLHVDIKINDHLINSIHIGREKGDTNVDSINTYVAFEGEYPTSYNDWFNDDAVEFTHRYGDDAEICVKKALEALYG